MSIELMSRIWKNPPVNGNELLLLLCLADMANDEGYCWPSLMTLARKTAVSKRSIIRLVQSLESQGLLSRRNRHHKDGHFRSNMYRVTVKEIGGGSDSGVTRGSDSGVTRVVTQESPRTINEPKESEPQDSLPRGQGSKPKPQNTPRHADDDTPDELPDIQMVKPKKEKAWPLLDAVKANWQFPRNANGMAMHLTQMLAGRSVTGSWAVSNLLIPAEPDEVEAFAKWWHRRRPGLAMPVTPEKVQLEFETYRTERDEEANRTFHRAPEMQANLLPPADRIEAVGSFSRFMDTLSQFGRFFKDGVLTWYTSAWRGDDLLYLCQHRDAETFLACPALPDGRPDTTCGITWEVYCDQHGG